MPKPTTIYKIFSFKDAYVHPRFRNGNPTEVETELDGASDYNINRRAKTSNKQQGHQGKRCNLRKEHLANLTLHVSGEQKQANRGLRVKANFPRMPPKK